jgi:hypothetical protein
MITRSIKSVATKEAKDKKIRRRHYLTLKRDYLQGKYDRFIWTEPKVGFKKQPNSRYRNYYKIRTSLFEIVFQKS